MNHQASLETNNDLTETAARLIQEAGIPVTPVRIAVWGIVAKANRPLSAKEVMRCLIEQNTDFSLLSPNTPFISLSSIYAILKRFTAAKLIETHSISGITFYSLPAQNLSQRILCIESGEELWFADEDLRKAIEAFCVKQGFALNDYTLSVKAKRLRKN